MNRQMFTPSASKLPCLMLALLLGLTTSLTSQPSQAAAENPTTEQPNGIYLYGESATADQIGQGYVVFSKKNGRVVGALYHPSSEFSCFSGAIADNQLQAVALEMGDAGKLTLQMSLAQMYQIQSLTETSKNTLSICEQEIAAHESGKLRAEKP